MPSDVRDALDAMGLELEPREVEQLRAFLGMLLGANETTNLTAITEPAAAWKKHILDALTLVPALSSIEPSEPGGEDEERPIGSDNAGTRPVRVIDIGSGGGVPALPLAIVLPTHDFTLVESTGKKARFLEAAVNALGLTNAHVRAERAETLGQDRAMRERFDAAMARALGHLAVVCELTSAFVRPGGAVLAVKGEKADVELEECSGGKGALGLLGLRHVQTHPTPTGRLVILEKTTRTPRTYPRRPGEPARVPLGLARN